MAGIVHSMTPEERRTRTLLMLRGVAALPAAAAAMRRKLRL